MGTLGFAVASKHARALEHALAAPDGPSHADLPRLAGLALALRRELEADCALGQPASAPAPTQEGPAALMFVDGDPERGHSLLAAAEARGVRALLATDLASASRLTAEAAPDVVLLELSIGTDADAAMLYLTEAAAGRPVMVVVSDDRHVDRVEVARRGGRGFLASSLDPAEMVGAAIDLWERVRVRVRGSSPSTTTRRPPDLVVLDFDMPQIPGRSCAGRCATTRAGRPFRSSSSPPVRAATRAAGRRAGAHAWRPRG